MNIRTISAALMALAAFGGAAAPLSPSDALDAALRSLATADAPAPLREAPASSYSLAWSDTDELCYVFTRGESGFIVASGDDTMPALIGFSSDSRFDADNIPPALEWLLEGFTDDETRGQDTRAGERAAVAPMLHTIWNQDSPFNDDCPTSWGSRTYTGCVATAMAQVLKYWEYPAKGTGTASVKVNGSTYKFDFASRPFEYKNMLDSYNGSYTSTQGGAVANLMYGCGMAAAMNYGRSMSSTTNPATFLGFVKYLGYDKSLTPRTAEMYTEREWEELLYAEMAAGRPVLYTGQGASGGHAFVCDGYRTTGGNAYFHINWGWGGLSDGYYLLTNLKPDSAGIGGATDRYSREMVAFTGIRPAQGDSQYVPLFGCYGTIATTAPSYTRSQTSRVQIQFDDNSSVDKNGLFNIGAMTFEVYLGLKFTDMSSGETKYMRSGTALSVQPYHGYSSMDFSSRGFPEQGRWAVTPVVCFDSKFYDCQMEAATRKTLVVDATASTLKFSYTNDPVPGGVNGVKADNPEVTGIYTLDGVKVNKPVHGRITIERRADGSTLKVLRK